VRQYAAPQAYVFRAARNRRASILRQKHAGMQIVPLDDVGPDLVADPASGVDREDVISLRQALRQLTARQQEVVILRIWADLPTKDVAEILGISEGTVKSTFADARAALSRLLQARPSDPDDGGAH
jgi:RNA polymerase sigma factor (sigma-70 family)